jgi:16S rRNA processing protein RimM
VVMNNQTPQNHSPFLTVGHVKDAHGIKGELYIHLYAGQADWLKKLKEVRLKSAKGHEVFTIERTRPHKEGLIFQLKEIKDRTKAESYKGRTFEIPTELLKSKSGESYFLYEILGYEVIDEKLGSVGFVKDFSYNGAQDLLMVSPKTINAPEYLIPFIKPFTQKIDEENKTIYMSLPDGLIVDEV